MFNLIKKLAPHLQTVLLILMLAVPFLLFYFARMGSEVGVIIFLVILGIVMLVTMKS